jgi:hypothetical protein
MVRRQTLFVLSLLIFIVMSLVLAACGESAKPTPVSGNLANTPATATVAPTYTPLPTYTALPTYTPFPTSTPLPTATPMPTATPVPLPTKIVLGDANEPWGEIVRYEPNSVMQLQPLPIDSRLQEDLKPWFKEAPGLVSMPGVKTDSGFLLTILPVAKPWVQSTFKQLTPTISKMAGSKAIPVAALGLNPVSMILLLNSVLSTVYLISINEQYKEINSNLSAIRSHMNNKDYSELAGNINYLNLMLVNLNDNKLTDENLKTLIQQLENIEREGQKAQVFAEQQMSDAQSSFEGIKFEKNAVVFANNGAIANAGQRLDEYRIASNIYYLALSARGLSANIMAAIPSNHNLALSRLQDVRKQLNEWKDRTGAFYKKVDERDGKMREISDSSNYNSFAEKLKTHKTGVSELHQKLGERVDQTVALVQTQINEADKPVRVYVELNADGSIKAAHKLNS